MRTGGKDSTIGLMEHPRARRTALVVGMQFHAQALASAMNDRSSLWRLVHVSNTLVGLARAIALLPFVDAVLCFGGPGPSAPLAIACRFFGKPVFVLWAGSDVSAALSRPHEMEALALREYVHGAVAPWLVDELGRVGISATAVDVAATDVDDSPAPFPKTFAVVTYLPEPRRAFYGKDRIYRLAKSCPDILFYVVGVGSPEAGPPNLRFLGHREDIENIIDNSMALVRLPEHDGHSVMVNETLARGRHVIWTNAVPGVHRAVSDDDAAGLLRALHARHVAGTLELNRDGMEYVRACFNFEHVTASVERFLERETVAKRTPRLRRVAVSGLTFFCARTCELVNSSTSPWRADLLETSSRWRKLDSMWTLARSDVWYVIGTPVVDSWLDRVASVLRKPRVMHWVGSDVGTAKNSPSLAARMRSVGAVHLAEVAWTAAQLETIGISAEIAPLLFKLPSIGVPPLPELLTVLLYVPANRAEFYGKAHYERLVAAFSGEAIQFVVVGGGHLDVPSDARVEHLGWISDLSRIYERCSALVRFTKFDGLSLMVLEALSCGRHVFWPQDFPYVNRLTDYDSLEAGIRRLLKLQMQSNLLANDAAASFVRSRFANDVILARIESMWDRAVESSSQLTASTVSQ